jgi:hypothetical protein
VTATPHGWAPTVIAESAVLVATEIGVTELPLPLTPLLVT